jgi:Zn-dependent protease
MDQLILWPPSWSMLLLLPALFVGFTVHEVGHAVVAFLLGDTSQLERRRLSWNPFRHISWVGLVVFLLFGFGWAKPVRVDASRFRVKNSALAMFAVSVAGASANVLTALLALLGMMATVFVTWMVTGASLAEIVGFLALDQPVLDVEGVAVAFSQYIVTVNLVLAFFNLLPLPPLDGFQALMSLITAVRTALGRGTVSKQALGPVSPNGGKQRTGGDADSEEHSETRPAQIHFDIGLEYHKSGQWDEAIARYRQATDHDDRFGLAYYNLGLAYWAKGRLSLAMSAFRAARACPGMVIQVHAGRRLRELTVAEQNPDVELGAVPSPLEPDALQQSESDAAPRPDAGVVRRAWLALAVGGVGVLLLAVAAWLYVTAVTLGEFGVSLF